MTTKKIQNKAQNAILITIGIAVLLSILVDLSEYFSNYRQYGKSINIVYPALSFVLITFIFWRSRRYFFKAKDISGKFGEVLCVLVLWIGFVCFTAIPVALIQKGYEERSLNIYKKELSEYRHDPAGFPYLQQYVKTNYHIQLVLDDSTKETWEYTEKKSPASMDFGWQFCVLRTNPSLIKKEFGSEKTQNRFDWVRIVSIHEVAHCLDIARDYGENVGTAEHKKSIAPDDRNRVNDLESFTIMSNTPSSTQWREVFADIFAVGYTRFREPKKAGELVTTLQRMRNDAKSDKTHQTSCWIKEAGKAVLPANEFMLIEWSDRIRMQAACKLT